MRLLSLLKGSCLNLFESATKLLTTLVLVRYKRLGLALEVACETDLTDDLKKEESTITDLN